MPELPQKSYLRRGEIRDYFGLIDRAMTKLVAAGVLTPCYLQGKGRAFFRRSEVVQAEKDGKIFNQKHKPSEI